MDTFFSALRVATLIFIILWFLVYWRLGAYLVNDLRKALPRRESRLDGILMAAITLLSVVVWNTGLFICLGRIAFIDTPFSRITALSGLAITLAGIVGTFYTRRQLGRLWAAAAQLQPNHHVMDQGIYSRIRHPIYTFAMLLNFGFCLVFPVWWNLLATIAILLCYALKALGEERFLLRSLPGYADYTHRVPYRLLPKIW